MCADDGVNISACVKQPYSGYNSGDTFLVQGVNDGSRERSREEISVVDNKILPVFFSMEDEILPKLLHVLDIHAGLPSLRGLL